MKQKITGVVRMVPLAVTMGTIFFLSHQPGNRLSLPPFPEIDKFAHLVAYGILAGTVLFAFSRHQKNTRPQRTMLLTVVFCLFYGASDEFHQSFIPGRSASVYDLFADFGGAALACVFWARWRKSMPMLRLL